MEDKASKLLGQVLRATYSGSISWRLSNAPVSVTRATDNFVPVFLEADYKGNVIVVYEERYKHWTDEENYTWTSGIRFGLYVDGAVVTEFVKWSPLLRQLYEEAKKNASGVESIIDNMLE